MNVKWAVEKIGLNDFIQSLPNGYDTILDPQGQKLPRSIMQKLLLARSIADKPKLLLLEDAFEHIDEQERIRIINFLTDRENSWTLVAVSTDPHIARASDRVAVMQEGRIIEIGPYNTLKKDHAQYFIKQHKYKYKPATFCRFPAGREPSFRQGLSPNDYGTVPNCVGGDVHTVDTEYPLPGFCHHPQTGPAPANNPYDHRRPDRKMVRTGR